MIHAGKAKITIKDKDGKVLLELDATNVTIYEKARDLNSGTRVLDGLTRILAEEGARREKRRRDLSFCEPEQVLRKQGRFRPGKTK